MNRIGKFAALSALSAVFLTSVSFAQDDHRDNNNGDHRDGQYAQHDNGNDHRDGQYVRHDDWRKGGRISHDDWNRGQAVDYRSHRLRRPPRGYEWRQVDGNYVLAAAATGIIASAIVASSHH